MTASPETTLPRDSLPSLAGPPPRPLQLAYAAACLPEGRDSFVVAAVVGSNHHTAVVTGRNLIHADLLAVQLAIEKAAPGALHLRVTSQLTVQAVQHPQQSTPYHKLVAAMLQEGQDRGIEVTIGQVSRQKNRAVGLALRHAQDVRNRGNNVQSPVPTVHLKVTPQGVSAHGVGVRQHEPPGLHAALHTLLALAPQLPQGTACRVKGVPAFTIYLWHHPEQAPPLLAEQIHQVRASLKARRIKLKLELSDPRPSARRARAHWY